METMTSLWERCYNTGQHISAVFQIPGLRICHILPDLMHVCCLGVLQYAQGNAMWEVFASIGAAPRSGIPRHAVF